MDWSITGDLTTQVKVCTFWTENTHYFIQWYLDISLLEVTYTRQQVQMERFLSPVLWQLTPHSVFCSKRRRYSSDNYLFQHNESEDLHQVKQSVFSQHRSCPAGTRCEWGHALSAAFISSRWTAVVGKVNVLTIVFILLLSLPVSGNVFSWQERMIRMHPKAALLFFVLRSWTGLQWITFPSLVSFSLYQWKAIRRH